MMGVLRPSWRLPFALVATLALLALAATAFGYWSGAESHGEGNGSAGAATVAGGAAPTVEEEGSTNVVVTWGRSILSDGTAVSGYVVKRYAEPDGTLPTISGGCSGTIAATTCTEAATPPGDWQYTVTPVIGTNWRGAESPKSGGVDTGPGSFQLNRELFGGTVAPLPAAVTGTISGFAPNETIAYWLDNVLLAGASPAQVGLDGTAAISFTLPAGTSDGPHSISVLGHTADASAGIVVDTTAPTISTFLTPAPNAAGWNDTAPVAVDRTASDGNGSGLAYAKYTDDGSDPKTDPNGTARFVTGPVSVSTTTTLKYYEADLAGNLSAVLTQLVKIDAAPPVFAAALVDIQGGVYQRPPPSPGVPGIAYYRGAGAGSLRFKVTPVVIPGRSPAISAGFSALPPDAFGFSFDASAVTTPPGGPFVSNPMTWTAGTTSNPHGTISLTNEAGSTFGAAGNLVDDSTAPTGGSVDASGLVGTAGRYSTSLTVSLQLTKGADAASGLADATGPSDVPATLMRASATLSSSDGVANGTCGTYSGDVQVGAANPASAVSDTVPTDRRCYRYRYLVSDHVGNVATYSSPDIKVIAVPAGSLAPSAATLSAATGVSSQAISGSTVYYNPAQSGSFNVDSSSTAPYTGIAQLSFPPIAGFTGGGTVTSPFAGSTFRSTYAWSANGASPSPGPQPITATNNAGGTASNPAAFSVIKDDVGPSGGAVDAIGLGGTGGRYATSTTLGIGFTPGTDAGAGSAPTGARLSRASASLTSNGTVNGTCGPFGAYTQVGADDPVTPKSDAAPVDRTCYRYHYVVSDRIGNQTTYTSPDVMVDATAPPVPALSFSAIGNGYWSGSGTTIYYRPGAASGGFRVTATSADTTSGTSAIGFPTLPAGWSSSSGGFGIRDYSWSAANPTAPSGSQTVTATNNAGGSASTGFTATPDGAAPAGGSITYAAGYTTAATISVAFANGTDAGSGLDAASGLLQRSSAPLSGGSCGTFDAFSTIAAAPATPTSTGVTTGSCYQYRYLISDNVGNTTTYASAGIVEADSSPPVVAIADPGADVRGTITVTVTADDDAGAGVTSVKLQIAPADTASWTDVCTDTGAPYSCPLDTTALTTGADYDLRAVATDGAGNSATSAIAAIYVDNVPPSVTMTNPGSTLSGVVALATTASDADSGVAGVTIQRAPNGVNTWTDACVISSLPWTCQFDTTTISDGYYDLRAIAVDAAGNSRTSTLVINRLVNNTTINSVSLVDPGAYLRGTVTLQANANAAGGIGSVAIQRSPAGQTTTWTQICSDNTSPYSCAFDTTTAATPDGLYDLRAVMTPLIGSLVTSATVSARQVDNAVVHGVDVQATNKVGGHLGRIEVGDTLTLTYATAMKPSTLIADWTGTGTASLSVILADANNVDSIALNSSGSTASGLGTVALIGNYIKKNKSQTFASTATLTSAASGGSVVTIVLGAATGTVGRTQSTALAMKWTPSATATNLAGIASSTAVVTETGTVDRDF